jgi:hypothetical protein
MYFFNFFYFSQRFLLGQEVANSLATNLSAEESDPNENIVDFDEPEKAEEDERTCESAIFEHCCAAGKVYLHYSPTKFSIFVPRGLNQRCRFSPPTEEGIMLFWDSEPPSDTDLITVAGFTGAPAHEFNFQKTTASVFIPSNRPLCAESTLLKTVVVPEGQKFRWLVVAIPFKKETPETVAEMDAFPRE